MRSPGSIPTADFIERLKAQFEGDFKLQFHMSPPVFMKPTKPGGEPRKVAFGGWMFSVLKLLAKMKGLRGSALDIFGYNRERKMERRLIENYRDADEGVLPRLDPAIRRRSRRSPRCRK